MDGGARYRARTDANTVVAQCHRGHLNAARMNSREARDKRDRHRASAIADHHIQICATRPRSVRRVGERQLAPIRAGSTARELHLARKLISYLLRPVLIIVA